MLEILLTQAVGAVAFLFLVSSFKKRNKKQIIKTQIIASSLFTLHYILLKAMSGTITSIIILFRNIFFSKYKKYEKKISLIFIFLFIISGLLMSDSWYSILPIIGASIYTHLMTKKKKEVLIGATINSVTWVFYNIFAKSYIGIITESIVVYTSLKAIKKMKKNNSSKNKEINNIKTMMK